MDDPGPGAPLGLHVSDAEGTEQGGLKTVRLPPLRPGMTAATGSERRVAEHAWQPASPKGASMRRTEMLIYLCGAVGLLELWALGRVHVILERPIWLLLVVLAASCAAGWFGDRTYRSHPSAWSLHLRVACQTLSVTVVIYLVGWGPALAIAYAFPLLDTGHSVGRRGRWALAVWPVIALGLAQVLVDNADIHLLMSRDISNGLALSDAFAIFFIWFQISQLTAGKEAAEREVDFAALHDPLTGLLNRSALAERLEGLLAAEHRSGRSVAVMFCDMLGFKEVNDCFGHEAGDHALAEVSRRLRATFRGQDLVARFAGDEFVIAFSAQDDPRSAVSAAERVLDALEVPVRLDGGSVLLGMSIGIAFTSTGRVAARSLLSEADQAMYEAKALHRSSWVLREID